jgi:FdhD protein
MESVRDRQQYEILQCRQGNFRKVMDVVVAEYNLEIEVNGQPFVILLCTPRSLENLVAGFLFSEGVIRGPGDLQEIQIDVDQQRARVTLRGSDAFPLAAQRSYIRQTVPTAGGKGHSTLDAAALQSLAEGYDGRNTIRAARVPELMDRFSKMSQLFADTGGVHSCALSDGDQILLFEDDIGRHNALDKVLGEAMMGGIALNDKVVLTSGRISTESLAKVARRGIPAIISRSAPTSAAIDQARTLNMTLIGFARGQNFNVYTNFSCLDMD